MTMPSGAGGEDAPIQSFSNCHAGIVTQLQALGGLPALVEAAEQARATAEKALKFFSHVVYQHHQDEERELFPAVLSSAVAGEERQRVQAMVDQLTREHREIEAAWSALESGLKQVAKGQGGAKLDAAGVKALVDAYLGHAQYEETEFLPLSQTILARNSNHMAALGLSLHTRHELGDIEKHMGFHV